MLSHAQDKPVIQWKPWQIILVFAVLQFLLTGLGIFMDQSCIGFSFIYGFSFFNALIVVLPILLIRRFGVGAAVYLPYALIGMVIDYEMEWVVDPLLTSPWWAVVFGLFGLAVGFSADLAFRFLPAHITLKYRSILTAITLGLVNFLTTAVGVSFFYKPDAFPISPAYSFLKIAWWALPWLIASCGLAGFTAWAMVQERLQKWGK